VKYISTRGQAPALEFDDVLLAGLASDGGLYVPESWPQFSAEEIASFKDLSYAETALRIIHPFVGETISEADLKAIIDGAYCAFDAPDVVPLKQLGDGEYLMEMFHGPTLAFKDVAMQFLGRVFDHVLNRRGERVTIVGATSGDTGAAAIEACRDRDAIDIFVLYPDGRVSDLQRRQMTTVDAANAHTIAIRGTFDDCQDLLKGMFNDTAFRNRFHLSAVNSINWARIVAQIVYYFRAAVQLGAPDTKVSFAVPTGNFGNVFSGYAAHRMGLPIEKLIVGSNSNDILYRFFLGGEMEISQVRPTLSPSMDIQVSSNFERLLFELYDRDGAAVAASLNEFRASGKFRVEADHIAKAREIFVGERFDDTGTKAMIKIVHDETGVVIDPHTAIGVAAARARRGEIAGPIVALATAHPGKFPDAITAAIGSEQGPPQALADLSQRREQFEVLENDSAVVQAHIAAVIEGAGK